MYGRRVTRGRKFFFFYLILIKHDDGMPVDVVLIGANRDVAKQDAGRIIAQATRILRGMGLYVACISIDRGSNPTKDDIDVLIKFLPCCVHALDNLCDRILDLNMISIAGNEIFPSVLKRVFNAENVAENNYVMQAAVKKFWKFFTRSATEKSFAKFRRAANHNFFGDITVILRRCRLIYRNVI